MTAIREIMRTDVLEVEMAATLQEAAQAMRERKISSLAVTEKDRLVGIMTERDIVTAVADGADSEVAHVRDYMTNSPVSAGAGTSVEEASQIMLEHGFRHLPVVDDDQRLIGIVSLRDLMRAGVKVPTRE
ncbi:MAG TPA: CBS domain-containing protein [Actinomycetota bacterium]|nr:CBS domain-containing protein [Actinomycetota bacterium]